MTAFTMHSCRSVPDRPGGPILFCLRALLLLLWLPLAASAAEVEVRNPQLQATDDGYAVSADFAIEFNHRLEEAVSRGVVLYFVVDFELSRARWYWLDEKLASRNLTLRLSYNALTRQYRLSSGALHQNFGSLEEAVHILSRLRNWQVLDKSLPLKHGETYQAALRLRLDTSQLPKPFQLTALANKEWNLASEWTAWPFSLTESREGGK